MKTVLGLIFATILFTSFGCGSGGYATSPSGLAVSDCTVPSGDFSTYINNPFPGWDCSFACTAKLGNYSCTANTDYIAVVCKKESSSDTYSIFLPINLINNQLEITAGPKEGHLYFRSVANPKTVFVEMCAPQPHYSITSSCLGYCSMDDVQLNCSWTPPYPLPELSGVAICQ